MRYVGRPFVRRSQLLLKARRAVAMQPVHRRDPRVHLFLRPAALDPYPENSFLEPQMALNDARRLLD